MKKFWDTFKEQMEEHNGRLASLRPITWSLRVRTKKSRTNRPTRTALKPIQTVRPSINEAAPVRSPASAANFSDYRRVTGVPRYEIVLDKS